MRNIPQAVTSGHSGGLSSGQEVMPKFHDHAAFPNITPRGLPQKVFGPTDFTNIPAADSYCQHHEITVTVIVNTIVVCIRV